MHIMNIFTLFSVCVLLVQARASIPKLPYCSENTSQGSVLVSTIDGKFSLIDSEGALKWQIETGTGPLLTSNIHNLELTNNGKWIRIIPSLTGALYRFDGVTIDPIPFSAESLLKSSYKYSDDLVMAGGLEVTTYGVGFRTGKIFYSCSSLKCINNTSGNANEISDDILLVERSTQTVRAVEPQSGYERWNFSVGHHNIKLPQVTCTETHNLLNWNITAIIPDGLLLSSLHHDNVQKMWQYHFSSPIVRVWKWNGHSLSEVDLFNVKNDADDSQISPAIYIGMHKRQLYIHEAYLSPPPRHNHISTSLEKIPWRPISASGITTEEDSTAMSVLYNSEYVNGNGYFLFSDSDIKKKNNVLCESNKTVDPDTESDTPFYWKLPSFRFAVDVVIYLSLMLGLYYVWSFNANQGRQNVIFVERHVGVPVENSNSKSLDRISESSSSDSTFHSRYMDDFDTLACLGKGGFGVVFEVQQKIDECHYAIKRISLPNEESKREAVMREVKALAKLEHNNIVRYFNSWVESPPYGWQDQYDTEWIGPSSDFTSEGCSTNQSQAILTEYSRNNVTNDSDSFIVFDDSKSKKCVSLQIDDESKNTDIVAYERSQNSASCRKSTQRNRCYSDSSTITKNGRVFLYIQMQLCQKQSLREWLANNKQRDFDNIMQTFKQIVAAVEYVHMQGLIHRDLKPSNIFFSLEGQIKVGDFGLVKNVEESYDGPHSLNRVRGHTKEVGTRLYMSPEQLDGKKYNYKVDIYSLGLIFFELLVYFSTDMERHRTLTDIRENQYPKDFIDKHHQEYELLTLMLCQLPEKRLTTFGIRARPPINNCDSEYNEKYDFELPKSLKATS